MREDDATLLQRYADHRSEDAFTEIVRRNMDAVYSAALRRVDGDAHLAQDVAQDVFVTVAHRAGELSRHPVLAAWLHTATRNAAANRIRTESRRRHREQEAHAAHELLADHASTTAWNQVGPVLDSAIDELSEHDRAAVALRFFERRTFVEMAGTLRMSEDAARMRVDRALDKLRRSLARRGVRSTASALGITLAQHAVTAAPPHLATTATAAPILRTSRNLAGNHGFLAGLNTAKLAAAAAIAAILTAGFFTFHFTRILRITGSDFAATSQNVAKLETQLRALQHRERLLAPELDRLQQTLRERPLPPPPSTAPLTSASQNPVPPSPRHARLAGGRRAALAASYDAFYRAMRFTPGQIRQFESISIQGDGPNLWEFEVDDSALDSTAPLLSPGQIDARLQAFLGPVAYSQYRDYNRSLPARILATRLASAVYLTDPLGQTQAGQLASLVARASPAHRSGATVDLASIDWTPLLRDAQTILSPAQLTALAEVRELDALDHAMALQIAQLTTPATPAASR